MKEKQDIPVFLINGFLDAGKTSFLSYTIGAEYFHIEGKTLLIVCENGETGYDEALLARENTTLEEVEDYEALNREYLSQLLTRTDSERVLIEYNGMWPDPSGLDLPDGWDLVQQITIIDGTTLELYLANMRSFIGPMLCASELCIVNRCDNITRENLRKCRKILRPMMPENSSIIMQNRYGEIPMPVPDEDLPYDVRKREVVIKPENYVTWFFDVRDYPERYDEKIVDLTAQVRRSDRFEDGVFALGRLAMVCCENDMTFLGNLATYEGATEDVPDGSWVKLSAAVEIRERTEYGGKGPFLIIQNMTAADPIEKPAGL